jgi:hypothetical protein
MKFAAVGFMALLAACAKDPPIYVTTALPTAPSECTSPATREPRLDETRDATDLDAAKDRVALKNAFRRERALRKSCGAQLGKLLEAAK